MKTKTYITAACLSAFLSASSIATGLEYIIDKSNRLIQIQDPKYITAIEYTGTSKTPKRIRTEDYEQHLSEALFPENKSLLVVVRDNKNNKKDMYKCQNNSCDSVKGEQTTTLAVFKSRYTRVFEGLCDALRMNKAKNNLFETYCK